MYHFGYMNPKGSNHCTGEVEDHRKVVQLDMVVLGHEVATVVRFLPRQEMGEKSGLISP